MTFLRKLPTKTEFQDAPLLIFWIIWVFVCNCSLKITFWSLLQINSITYNNNLFAFKVNFLRKLSHQSKFQEKTEFSVHYKAHFNSFLFISFPIRSNNKFSTNFNTQNLIKITQIHNPQPQIFNNQNKQQHIFSKLKTKSNSNTFAQKKKTHTHTNSQS